MVASRPTTVEGSDGLPAGWHPISSWLRVNAPIPTARDERNSRRVRLFDIYIPKSMNLFYLLLIDPYMAIQIELI
jgi:hypothetical protein